MRFVTCVCASALSALFAYSAQAQSSPTVTFSASPTSIPNGQSSTLAWSSANATACSGTGKGFSPSGPSGSLAVSPKITTTYGITCTGAGGSASQSVTVAVTAAPTLTVGETVAATGTVYVDSTPSESARDRLRVARQPGRGHRRSSEQRDHMVGGSLQRRPYRVGCSGRCRGRIANGAASLVQRESCEHPALGLVDAFMVVAQRDFLQRSGFSPSGVSGSLSVLPTATTVYSITCTGSGGSTTQSAQVVVNPYPTIGMTVAAIGHCLRQLNSRRVRPRSAPSGPATRAWSSAVQRATGAHGGRSPSTTALPGGFIRAVSRSYRQRRRQSRSARILRASPPASRRRFHGRRPTRLPAAERASLHRAPQDLSPSCRLQPPFTASPAQAVADRQLNQCKWS